MPRTLFNLVAFQLGWFACVVAGSLIGGLIAAAIVVVHLLWLARPGEWRWLVGFAALGLFIDGGLALAGGFTFSEPSWLPLPLWLWAHPWLAMLGGAIGGPLSYFGGARLSDVELAPWLLPLEALIWGALCVWLSRRLGGSRTGPVARD
jgi:hypothetical protein